MATDTQSIAVAASAPAPSLERERAQYRRTHFGIERPPAHTRVQWALALSGGGIRSATFCLGVLQGLARSPGPEASDPAQPLLYQFDYLSTVSGGGYIGSFLSSLYVPGRVSGDAHESSEQAAQRVAQVLREDPPGRMHRVAKYDPEHPGRTALAWLRDNGRYLAPSGAGDYLYGAGLALRNWVSTQYVVGTAICLAMALIALLRWTLIVHCQVMSDYEESLLNDAAQRNGVWWSTLWWLCLPVLLLGVLPLGAGYWFSYVDKSAGVDVARPFTKAAAFGFLLGLLFLAAGWWTDPDAERHSPINFLGLATGLTLLVACLWYRVSYSYLRNKTVTEQRVLLTRWLTTSLAALLLLAAAAAIDTLSQTVQLNFEDWKGHLVTSGSLMAAAVWIARSLVEMRSEKSSPGWLAKVPVGVLAMGGGLLLWLLAATGWHLLLHTMIWNTVDLRLLPYTLDVEQIWDHAAAAAIVCFALALIVGLFPGFLNLSTLQGLYSARLTRSYLGASNHERFTEDFAAARSVAEPIKNDGLALQDIYRNPYAPMHLINVCVNQTVDPAEQLIQRDRKGKPLVVAPNGFYLDGEPYAFASGISDSAADVANPLTLGEWVGVSGAAFTTGLGRSTSLGMSLLLGFANVRLGRWWPSGVSGSRKDRNLRRVFKTQVYLLDEIRGSFYGTGRDYQYLSDGGHFENTAVYELLRRDRQVRLILVCDCGCDPSYRFGDLANLMRLARIDHRLELRVNEQVTTDPVLGAVFGRPGDLTPVEAGTTGGSRCALLVDVFQPPQGQAGEQLVARIIVLKPRLIDGVALDVVNYQSQHPAFPQEPTGDQFYDEAQWESYRKLGLTVAGRVFPQDPTSVYGRAFWRQVLS